MNLKFTKIDNSISKIIVVDDSINLYYLKYAFTGMLSSSFKIPYDEVVIIKINHHSCEFKSVDDFITMYSYNTPINNIWSSGNMSFIVSSYVIINHHDLYSFFRESNEFIINTEECPCCYEKNKKSVTPYNCKHKICYDCYNEWCNKSGSNCPMCRAEISYLK